MKKLLLLLLLFPLISSAQKTVTSKNVITVRDATGSILKTDSSSVTTTILPEIVIIHDTLYLDTSASQPPANKPPTANAGADRSITLPTNTLSVTGSGSDPEGGALSYKWTRTATGELLSSTANVNLTFSVAGSYIYTFTVTDNKGLTATDQLVVTVNAANPPPNTPPSVNAGSDKTITLPVSSVVMNGSASDAEGSVNTGWSRISGPTSFTFSSQTPTATVSGLVAGTYTFRLTGTDNAGASATDDVTVVVNPEVVVTPPNGTPIQLSFTQLTTDFTRQFSGAEIWVGNQWNTTIPNVSKLDEYDRFGGGQLETSQGVYNFKPIGDKINSAIERGAKFSYGLMTYFPGAQVGYKEVVKWSDGSVGSYPEYLHKQMQADALKDWKVDNTWVPNWNSEYYLAWWERLNKALYNYLNTTSYKGVLYKNAINYIDLRGFGEFGEWHMYYEHGKEPANLKETEPALRRIIEAQRTAYPDIRLVALSDGFLPNNNNYVPAAISYLLLTGKNDAGEFGFRHDHVGSDLYPESFKYEGIIVTYNGVKLGDLVANKWKVAPVVGEPHLSSTYKNLPAEVQRYHFNSFGNGNYSPSSTIAPNIISASKLSGARAGITSGQLIPGTGSLSVTLNWSNTGLCPPYEAFNVIYELRQGSTVIKSYSSNLDIKTLLPGTKAATDIISGIPSGTYELRVKVINPSGYRTFTLSNTGKQSDGSYILKTNLTIQ